MSDSVEKRDLRVTPHLLSWSDFLHRQVQFFHNAENRFHQLVIKKTTQRHKRGVLTLKSSVQKSRILQTRTQM